MKEKFIIKRITLCACGCGVALGAYYNNSETFTFGNMGDIMKFDAYKDAQDNIDVLHALGSENVLGYQIEKIFVP